MQTLTISARDQATVDKLVWLLKSLKDQGIEIISQKKDIPISKNVPNARTVAAFNDEDYEEVDDLRAWMNENC